MAFKNWVVRASLKGFVCVALALAWFQGLGTLLLHFWPGMFADDPTAAPLLVGGISSIVIFFAWAVCFAVGISVTHNNKWGDEDQKRTQLIEEEKNAAANDC